MVQKFAKYHGFEFEFAERSKEDKQKIKEFRDESLSSKNCLNKFPGFDNSLSELVYESLSNPIWCMLLKSEFIDKNWIKKKGEQFSLPSKFDIKQCAQIKASEFCQLFFKKASFPGANSAIREDFIFPEMAIEKVRCDGYLAYLDNYYWLGDSWIGRKLQVLDDGTNVEFFEKAQFIRGYKRQVLLKS